MTSETKRCRSCGAEFKKSRADFTVRCPACRAARRDERRGDGHRSVETCRCGKTVVATWSDDLCVRTPTGWTCPRECDAKVVA